MSNLEKVFSLSNLRRAYRWILSNPDANYKSYFRDSYESFAIASDTHLRWIRQEGLRERYQASHASKILVPKPSGALRPITLLTVEDQIVYQACVNLVADAIKRRTSKRYEKTVFAHLYAGKTSRFFYVQWQRSYRKFAKRVESAYGNGYEFIADFDLTSFYDSIDHDVLRHFLNSLYIDEDTTEFLLQCLKIWTSSTWSNGPQNIYHAHGIPQGPLSSGMLSEVILEHIDKAGEQGRKSIYLRYVDDIKILAKNEEALRRKLIKLDITSKEIGLFPQTAKINIHRIRDPHEEVKSVSHPPEPSLRPTVDQKSLVARILELSRHGKIAASSATRIKYLLARAKPTYRLNARMVIILKNHPELAPQICRYISDYKRVPPKLASDIHSYVAGAELYHSVSGALLRACLGKFPPEEAAALGRFCADRLIRPKRGTIPIQPSYKEALVAWGLNTNTITFAEYDRIIEEERDWWVKKCSMRELSSNLFGAATYADFINRNLRTVDSEVARIAATRLIQDGLKLTRPYRNVENTAKQMLKVARAIRVGGQPESRINQILAYIIKRKETNYDWKKFFGGDHGHAERMMIFLKRNRDVNIDAFLVLLDSYFDLITYELYKRLKPTKIRPPFGTAIKDPTLNTKLPEAMICFQRLHALRLESATAHPKNAKSGKETRRLKHSDFYKVRRDILKAFDEIESAIIP